MSPSPVTVQHREDRAMQAQHHDALAREQLQDIEAIMGRACPPGAPGAAVIVAKGGHVVFRRGYGTANLELRVPIAPDMAFRIGSITVTVQTWR